MPEQRAPEANEWLVPVSGPVTIWLDPDRTNSLVLAQYERVMADGPEHNGLLPVVTQSGRRGFAHPHDLRPMVSEAEAPDFAEAAAARLRASQSPATPSRVAAMRRALESFAILWFLLSLFVLPAWAALPIMLLTVAALLALGVVHARQGNGRGLWSRWQHVAGAALVLAGLVALSVWRFDLLKGTSDDVGLKVGDCFVTSIPGGIPAFGANQGCLRLAMPPALRAVPLYRVVAIERATTRREALTSACEPGSEPFLTLEEDEKLGRGERGHVFCAVPVIP